MNVRGKAFVFGDRIDTDVLAPGPYMREPLAVLASHCLEAVDPDFAGQVRPGDIVVGDDDGVLFISPAHADALAAASRKKLADETATLAAIANGTHDDAWIDQALRAKGVLPK